ncbi:MAG: hypothetical protein NTX64_15285, partial [Elusimicrobia bacterium]|nr:hypothetical protein [Elusimicrobiota bacterium]
MSRRDCVVLCVLVFMAATLYLVFSRGSQQESMVLEDVGPLSPPGEPLKGPPGLPVARSLLPVIIDGRRSTPAAPPP